MFVSGCGAAASRPVGGQGVDLIVMTESTDPIHPERMDSAPDPTEDTTGPVAPEAIHPADAFIAHTKSDKGLGAYAARVFKAGEVVEVCPVIVFDKKLRELPRSLQLRVFDWGVLADTRPSNCLPLGCGAIYNHHEPSNMTAAAIDTERFQGLVFTAVRDIERGEELTVNYNAEGGGHTWHDDNWFERLNIVRVKHAPSYEERDEEGNGESASRPGGQASDLR